MLRVTILGLLIITLANNTLAADNRIQHEVDYKEVVSAVLNYLGKNSDIKPKSIISKTWHRKTITPKDLNVQKYQQFSASKNSGLKYEITSVEVHYGNFAMVRVDDRSKAMIMMLTLFKHSGKWKLANEILLSVDMGTRHKHFSAETSANQVVEAMATYYRAVEYGQAEKLRPLFHTNWHMKNPEDGQLVAENKSTFIRRIEKRPLPGYFDDRQTSKIEILFERVAVVRVDNPSTQSTTIFTFVKNQNQWLMIDKAWSHPATN